MAHAASVFVSFLGALFYRSTFLGALCAAHSGMTMHLQSGVPCLPAVCRGLKYNNIRDTGTTSRRRFFVWKELLMNK